jgi:excisionase family DNA binding protein
VLSLRRPADCGTRPVPTSGERLLGAAREGDLTAQRPMCAVRGSKLRTPVSFRAATWGELGSRSERCVDIAVEISLRPYKVFCILSHQSARGIPSPPMTDRPMTVDEVARFCGVSAKTVRRAIERGDLEAARLGGHGALRIRPEAIDEWFARRSTRRTVRGVVEAPPVPASGGRRRQRLPTQLRVGEDMACDE